MKKKGFHIFCLRIIPKALVSRIVGFITRIPFPKRILNACISLYCKKYSVNTDEIQHPPNGFRTFDHFFTRKLLPGVHTVDENPLAIVSPVDGRIDQFGKITGTRILQAKNIDYLLSYLLPSFYHSTFIDGSFMTIYLSPADYHRIHSPVDGVITGVSYIPGKLFPVREYVVNGLAGLFSINERMVTCIDTAYGKCVVCKVGAMNVGRISLSYSDLVSNTRMFRGKKEEMYPSQLQPYTHKGDELGIFHLGSTVILLFENDMVQLTSFRIGTKVRMGQPIGLFKTKNG
jgi:phosphatidylserine decarboxylase